MVVGTLVFVGMDLRRRMEKLEETYEAVGTPMICDVCVLWG